MLCLRKTCCSSKVGLGLYSLKAWEVTTPTRAHGHTGTCAERYSHALSLRVSVLESLE